MASVWLLAAKTKLGHSRHVTGPASAKFITVKSEITAIESKSGFDSENENLNEITSSTFSVCDYVASLQFTVAFHHRG